MARQRKQKQRDAVDGKTSHGGGCAVVRHQKLCLAIDIENQRISGHTELQVIVPKGGVVGLHANGLHIEEALVEGMPVKFKLTRQQEHKEPDSTDLNAAPTVTCSEAADNAHNKYIALLEEETLPDLLIFLPDPPIVDDPAVSQLVPENSKEENNASKSEDNTFKAEDNTSKTEECIKCIRLEYWVERPEVGVYFQEQLMYTDNQIRRARCWFPCVDNTYNRSSYHLELTVNSGFVAVASGKLLYQVLSKDDERLKTYVYSLDVPTSPGFLSVIVAPLVVLPDRQNASVSHMCLPGSVPQLQCSVSFFHSLFSFFEEYLGAAFPFGCFKHVFIDSEYSISPVCVGASLARVSSHLLVDDRIIDQTISTRIKLAHALAQQWFGVFISAECPEDEWLLDGLAGFLTDVFTKRFLGNNEAQYRRYKASEDVLLFDIEGAPPLSPPGTYKMNSHGTEKLGFVGKIRASKAVAVIHMLEKQMGPEPFHKILKAIIGRAQSARQMTLSTKEFRHLANKIGNLERPFLKEFFPRWVESPGCPLVRMGFAYNKRRNMVELAVHRGCTASDWQWSLRPPSDERHIDIGWPGMMSIRLYEIDGMYDHPNLPMSGDVYQLLELQCHSKLAGKRFQRPKKGKPDGSDECVEPTPASDARPSLESPLLWVRADPGMEYLAEIHLRQPEHMWINQLERDRDIVGQIQAIAALQSLPPSFAIVNALNNCLVDTKAFCRVRIEAAFALATTATEMTSWVGFSHLLKYYKNRCFDPDIGLPRSNDFRDLAEYFVLQAIPFAIAAVRGKDNKSPSEAVEFILSIMKHNDNSGNCFSDAHWLASVIRSIGNLEFGDQTLQNLPKMLKQVDRFLQYDRLMPSYNNIVTRSCIFSLGQLGQKFLEALPMETFEKMLWSFKDMKVVSWKVWIAALESLMDIRTHSKGLDSALSFALELIEEEPSPTGGLCPWRLSICDYSHCGSVYAVQRKIMQHMLNICISKLSETNSASSSTCLRLHSLLISNKCFRNVLLRHHVFTLLQILGGRSATLLRKECPQSTDALAVAPRTVEALKPVKDEIETKSPTLKVRPPKSVHEVRSEPLKIRLNASSLNLKRDMDLATILKREDDKKVGIVKLRIKPNLSAGNDDAQSDILKDVAPELGTTVTPQSERKDTEKQFEGIFPGDDSVAVSSQVDVQDEPHSSKKEKRKREENENKIAEGNCLIQDESHSNKKEKRKREDKEKKHKDKKHKDKKHKKEKRDSDRKRDLDDSSKGKAQVTEAKELEVSRTLLENDNDRQNQPEKSAPFRIIFKKRPNQETQRDES